MAMAIRSKQTLNGQQIDEPTIDTTVNKSNDSLARTLQKERVQPILARSSEFKEGIPSHRIYDPSKFTQQIGRKYS